jgi:hypothetical protein
MEKPLRELKIETANSFYNIPKVKPGEVLITPNTQMLYDPEVMPIDNWRNWPDWWKDLDSGDGALRRCSGTADYISLGFNIPMWARLHFRPSPDGSFWESRFDIAGNHEFHVEGFGFHQSGECPVTRVRKLERANYIKIINPWLFKTAPGWSSIFLPPLWEPNPNYTLLPALVNTDYYHHANIVLNILTDKEFTIEIGEIMQHVVPIPRQKGINYIWGDGSIYDLLSQRGFKSTFIPINQKSRYKKEQRDKDELLEKKDGKGNWLSRMLEWIANRWSR